MHARFMRLGWGIFFYSYTLVLRATPGTMKAQLEETLNLSSGEIGWLFGCHFLTYTVFQGLMGSLLLRYGARKIFLNSLASCIVGLLLMANASSSKVLTLGRLLIGAGGASAFLGTLSVGRHDGFTPTLTAASLVICGKLSLLVMWPAITYLVVNLHYSYVLVLLAIVGIALILGILIYMPLLPAAPLSPPSIEMIEKVALTPTLLQQRSTLAIVMLCGGLLSSSLLCFGETWGSSYIATALNLPVESASQWILCVFLGTLIGAVALPLALKKISSHALFVWGTFGGWLCTCSFILGEPQHPFWIMVCLSGIGFFLSVQLLVFEFAHLIVPLHPFEKVTSWVNLVLNGFNFLTPYLIGVLLKDFLMPYNQAFKLIIAYTSLAFLCALWLFYSATFKFKQR